MRLKNKVAIVTGAGSVRGDPRRSSDLGVEAISCAPIRPVLATNHLGSPTAGAIRARVFNETGREEEAQADIQMARKLSLPPNVTHNP